jgi:hypothetical protein
MYISYAVPQALPTRVAGGGSKSFCPEMCASFFNSRTRALKLFSFAPQSEKL